MPIKKLSAAERHEINRSPFRVKKADYSGQALAYLTRTRNRAKVQRAKKKGYVNFGKMLIPGNSEAYEFIEAIAKQKKMSVKQVAKKYGELLKPLLVDKKFPIRRATDNLIDDISVAVGSVFINGKKYSKTKAKYLLTKNTNEIKGITGAFVVIPKVEINFKGNIYVTFPEKLPTLHFEGATPTEDEMDEYDREVEEFLEDHDVTIIVSSDEQ